MPIRARERLLQAAEELFYAEGIRAVGVDRLLTASGVGRASFYRHFASKDALVVDVLLAKGQRWRAELADAVAVRGNDPLAIFDVFGGQFGRSDFRGCAFINAMVEAADWNSPAHRVAADHKHAVTVYLDGLLAAAGHGDHAVLAEQFMLLLDGAVVTALRDRSAEPARQAKAVAAALLAR